MGRLTDGRLSEYGLLLRAWFEFSNDRTRLEDQAAMVQV